MARISDVAKHANVSTATVSRVFSNAPYVSDALRQRVLEAARELDYRPSRVAQSLSKQRSSIIGLIISDIENPFFTSLVRAVEDEAYRETHTVFLCNSDEDVQKEKMYIDLLLSEQVAGAVICPTQEQDNPAKRLLDAGIPVVSVDRRMFDLAVDTVVIDNVGAARELVEHLIGHGHHQIGTVLAPKRITTGRERLEGYEAALEAHGITIDKNLIRTGIPNEQEGYRMTQDLLDLADPPTALMAGNNMLTLGLIRAVRERSLRIPEDMAVVAFDDMSWSTIIDPPLTVVRQPTYEMGRTAIELLMKRAEDPRRSARSVILKPPVCIRASCGEHDCSDSCP